MKQDPKEVLEMLNIILEQIRPCRISNTTIIEDIQPESVEFVIRSAIQCIDQIDYKHCKQQLSAEYGITVSESEPVIHAIWINDTYCSNCKRFPVDVSVPISNQELTKYFSRCPHCGAKMK